MVEKNQSLLASNEPISKLKTLNHNIYVFLDPKTREVETLLSIGPFGTCEYDKEGQGWAMLHPEDTWRVHTLFNDYVQYEIDWKNDKAFDNEDKSLAITKYIDGTLDENWLDQNTILREDAKA